MYNFDSIFNISFIKIMELLLESNESMYGKFVTDLKLYYFLDQVNQGGRY